MNVAELVATRAYIFPNAPAIIHADGTWTFRELIERADAIACEVRKIATGPCPRIALHCQNGPDYVALALGILLADACFIPVPSELAVPERMHLLELTAAHAIISAGPKPWLPVDTAANVATAPGFSWASLKYAASFPEDRFTALNPAFVRFSSGTTGASKGVVISHESLLARIESANTRLAITPADRVLWTLPMAHHFAVSIMLYLSEGAATVIEDSHLAADVLATARRSGATVFYGSPFHLALLAADESGLDWPTLRLAVGTAAAVPAHVSAAFAKRYGIWPAQGFGIIECGLPLLNIKAAATKPESVGFPTDFEISIRPDDGDSGGLGELWLRGPGMFDAYLSPWKERADLTEDGWFATGDLAVEDVVGHIFLRGRKKTVINFGGMKFFPEEVEIVLNTHPGVRESRVRSEGHERWGSVAIAEIVPRDPAAPPTPPSLAKHCRSQLASYKVPVRFECVPEIPKTASGKIRR